MPPEHGLRTVMLPPPPSSGVPMMNESRVIAGLDLDVGAVILVSDRHLLERLCRYALRPPLPSDRVEELAATR